MRFLASCGVFTEEVDDNSKQLKYGLNGVSKLLVKEENKESCVPFLLLAAEKVYLDAYHHIQDAVLEGCYPFNKVYGISLWEYYSRNPEANKIFNEGMACHTKGVMVSVVKMYDGFKSVKSLVDVAGGVGSALSIIIKEHPHTSGINFDLPHVIAAAPAIPGVEHVRGNMFEQIPSGDIVFMKKSYEATPKDGKVIIEEEVKELFFRAGFKSYNVIKLPFLQAFVEVSKS